MNRLAVTLATITASTIGIGGTAQAAKINVFSTGVDSFGNEIPNPINQSIIDQNWTVDNGDAFVIPNEIVDKLSRFQPNTENAKWIFPGQGNVFGNTTYIYKQTFDLSGLDPSTASISGFISSDNGASIFLNGIDTGITTPTLQWRQPAKEFNLANGFVDGLNTLEVRVSNGAADTNLYVDITNAVANSKSVPEPLTILGSATALGVGGLLKREHSKKQNKS